jgi:hypothetical protein
LAGAGLKSRKFYAVASFVLCRKQFAITDFFAVATYFVSPPFSPQIRMLSFTGCCIPVEQVPVIPHYHMHTGFRGRFVFRIRGKQKETAGRYGAAPH